MARFPTRAPEEAKPLRFRGQGAGQSEATAGMTTLFHEHVAAPPPLRKLSRLPGRNADAEGPFAPDSLSSVE
jgi:hypothetical protein